MHCTLPGSLNKHHLTPSPPVRKSTSPNSRLSELLSDLFPTSDLDSSNVSSNFLNYSAPCAVVDLLMLRLMGSYLRRSCQPLARKEKLILVRALGQQRRTRRVTTLHQVRCSTVAQLDESFCTALRLLGHLALHVRGRAPSWREHGLPPASWFFRLHSVARQREQCGSEPVRSAQTSTFS